MQASDVKFSEWLRQGFDLFKANAGILIVASLLAILISSVTLGILAGPMMAGLSIITLALVDRKDKPEIGTLFKGFDFFLPAFLFVLVWGLVGILAAVVINAVTCGVGAPVVAVGGIVMGALLMFGTYLIVDRKLDFWPASVQSFNAVKPAFWPLLGFYAVASIIGSAGSILCGIGMIVTWPIAWCMYAVAYRACFPAEGVVAPAGEPVVVDVALEDAPVEEPGV